MFDLYSSLRQSLTISHDHSYCRLPYLESINTICIESFPDIIHKQDDLSYNTATDFVDTSESQICITEQSNDIYDDFITKLTATPQPCSASYNSESIQRSYTDVKYSWNVSVERLINCLKKHLIYAELECSIGSHKFQNSYDIDFMFRNQSIRSLVTKQISKYIRKLFGLLHSRINVCVDLHEHLINTLPNNQLSVYLKGFINLMHQNKINNLLRKLNSDVCARKNVVRFSYEEFLDWISKHNKNNHYSLFSSHLLSKEKKFHFSPVSFLPPLQSETAVNNPVVSSTTDEPIFLCILFPNQLKSIRISNFVQLLSRFGQVITETINELNPNNARQHIRTLNKVLSSLNKQIRTGSIYIVGWGLSCLLIIASVLQFQPEVNHHSYSYQSKPFESGNSTTPSCLSGIICLGMPFTGFSVLGKPFENLAHVSRRCSILFIVGARSRFGGECEAQKFMSSLIASRRISTQLNPAYPTVSNPKSNVDDIAITSHSSINESDVQLLIIGGCDHKLRVHSCTSKRWSAPQEAIDSAIIIAIKNFVLVCRGLSTNTSDSVELPCNFTPPHTTISTASHSNYHRMKASKGYSEVNRPMYVNKYNIPTASNLDNSSIYGQSSNFSIFENTSANNQLYKKWHTSEFEGSWKDHLDMSKGSKKTMDVNVQHGNYRQLIGDRNQYSKQNQFKNVVSQTTKLSTRKSSMVVINNEPTSLSCYDPYAFEGNSEQDSLSTYRYQANVPSGSGLGSKIRPSSSKKPLVYPSNKSKMYNNNFS